MALYPTSKYTPDAPGTELADPAHSGMHIETDDELVAVIDELGFTPSGTYSTVKARLDAIQTIEAQRTTFTSYVPAGSDTTGINGTTFVSVATLSSVTVPSWATAAIATISATNVWGDNPSDISAQWQFAIGSANFTTVRQVLPSGFGTDGNNVGHYSWTVANGSVAPGSQAVNIRVRRSTAGSTNFLANAASNFNAQITFLESL